MSSHSSLWARRFAVPIILAWLAIAVAVSSAQQTSATEEQLSDLSSRAQSAQQQGDYRTAANCYEEIVKLRPDVAEAWANLGLMHQFLEEYPQADHDFQVALSKNSRLYVPNLFLGLNQLRVRQPAQALRFLKIAQSLNPKDEQAAMGLAHAYQASHDDIGASKWYAAASEINPGDPDAWYGLGTSYLSLQDAAVIQLAKLEPGGSYARSLVADAFVVQGRDKDAIDIYKKLLASPAQPPCLLAALGFAEAKEDTAAAQKAFQDELTNRPGCLMARLGLAHLSVSRGDFAEALQESRAAWDVDHRFVHANTQRIWDKTDPDQLGKAAVWLQQNSSHDRFAQFLLQSIESGGSGVDASGEPTTPTPPLAHDPESLLASGHYTACQAALQKKEPRPSLARALLLAQCSFYSGDYQAALVASVAALKIDAQNSPALYWKARSSQELAAEALERMSNAAPGSAKVHLVLAELHRAREEFAAAEAEYKQVLASGSDDPAAHLGLGQVYYQESQDDKAVEQLQLVLQANPTSAQASLVMGQVLVRRHQYADAVPYLKTALNGSPLALPQVHFLLARCLAGQGDYAGALSELKLALPSDTTGIFHYQLYQIYQKLGDAKAAAVALQESEKLRREESQAEQKQKAMEGADSQH